MKNAGEKEILDIGTWIWRNWFKVAGIASFFVSIISLLYANFVMMPAEVKAMQADIGSVKTSVTDLTKTVNKTDKSISYLMGILKLPFKPEEITQL